MPIPTGLSPGATARALWGGLAASNAPSGYMAAQQAFADPTGAGWSGVPDALGQAWNNLRGVGSVVGERIRENPWGALSAIFSSQKTPEGVDQVSGGYTGAVPRAMEGIFPGGAPTTLLPEQPSPRGLGYQAAVSRDPAFDVNERSMASLAPVDRTNYERTVREPTWFPPTTESGSGMVTDPTTIPPVETPEVQFRDIWQDQLPVGDSRIPKPSFSWLNKFKDEEGNLPLASAEALNQMKAIELLAGGGPDERLLTPFEASQWKGDLWRRDVEDNLIEKALASALTKTAGLVQGIESYDPDTTPFSEGWEEGMGNIEGFFEGPPDTQLNAAIELMSQGGITPERLVAGIPEMKSQVDTFKDIETFEPDIVVPPPPAPAPYVEQFEEITPPKKVVKKAKTQAKTTKARKAKKVKDVKVKSIAKTSKVTKSAASQALSRARGNVKDANKIAKITKSFTAAKKKDPKVYMPTIRKSPSGAWVGGF